MSVKFIATDKAPGAVGPYSQGTRIGNIIFTSGQLPVDMETGELSKGDIKRETRLCLENVRAILEAEGGKIENIAKVTVFVTDVNDFSTINAEYEEFFGNHKPARSLVEVAALPKGANIEIEAIASI